MTVPLGALVDVCVKVAPLTVVETGPELTLGECIAIAIERHPHLKAVKASTSASTTGFNSLINFGTLGTLVSPDLDIRKQQAQRGLEGAAGSYQKEHNEIVQDATRLYYSAVYAKQQQGVADGVVERLASLGAIGVRGNHDAAAIGGSEIDWFNPEARAAMEWTRATISGVTGAPGAAPLTARTSSGRCTCSASSGWPNTSAPTTTATRVVSSGITGS